MQLRRPYCMAQRLSAAKGLIFRLDHFISKRWIWITSLYARTITPLCSPSLWTSLYLSAEHPKQVKLGF